MIEAEEFIGRAREYGFGLYSGVPCSYLKPFINYVIDSDALRYVGAANEGDAVAIAAGAELGGLRGVAMFQNSGFGNAVNPLTSLTYSFRIPILLIVTLRGEPGGAPDEPQHELMGQITTGLCDLMGIPWAWFPQEPDEVAGVLERAVAHMDGEQRPFALVMRKGSVSGSKLKSVPDFRTVEPYAGAPILPEAQRGELLRAVQAATSDEDIVVATTGYTGRELYATGDRGNQLYMVGSMGCAASLGLGLAIARPQRRVIVLDGDGAALMRLGVFATLGYERPPNLVHVLLDNGLHESTGGQATVSRSVDFCSVAAACGYPRVETASRADTLGAILGGQTSELTFVHAPILPGVPELPRPSMSPPEVAERLRANLTAGA
jgi:phosphonopyruvate decarboxylase